MTIVLTEQNKIDIKAKGYERVIFADSFTTFTELFVRCNETQINEIANIIGLPTYQQALSLGYFADLDAFAAYLRTSVVYRLAALSSAKNAAMRKLFFELNFWLTSEVGLRSPGLMAACWSEMIALTKGTLVAQLSQAQVDEWNAAVVSCRMLASYKLTKI